MALDEIAQEAQLPETDKDNEIPHGTDEDGKGSASCIKQNLYLTSLAVYCFYAAFRKI